MRIGQVPITAGYGSFELRSDFGIARARLIWYSSRHKRSEMNLFGCSDHGDWLRGRIVSPSRLMPTFNWLA
jgi:hypothetical protein